MKRWVVPVVAVLMLALTVLFWPREPLPAVAAVPEAPAASRSSPPAETSAPITEASAREPAQQPAPAAPAASPSPTPPPAAAILVRGSVRDEHGELVPSAMLRWIDAEGVGRAVEVAAGSYACPGLHPGSYVAEFSGAGWHREQHDVELAPQPELQQHDFRARANATILIKALDQNGAPLVGQDADGVLQVANRLRAFASREAPAAVLDPAQLLFRARSDCGSFQTRWQLHLDTPGAVGQLEISEDPPLFVSLVLGCAVLATRTIDALPPEIVFTLSSDEVRSKLSGLRLRLLTPDGSPAAGGGMVMLHSDSVLSRPLGADGRVEFAELLPGGYSLTLTASGCGRQQREIVLEPGRVLDLGDVRMRSQQKQRVQIVFPGAERPALQFVLKPELAGDPLGTLGPLDNSGFGTEGGDSTEISFPGPGSYELRVTHVGDPRREETLRLGARPRRVVLGDEPAGELEIRLEATSEICLRPPQGSSGPSRWLVATAEGLPCSRARIEGRAPTRIELVPGAYTIARIDPATNALGKPQAFTVGKELSTVDLEP